MNEPIAIIGVDARFPGEGDSADKFYDFLLAGRSARTEIPQDRYDVNAFWHPDASRQGKTTTRAAHLLSGDIFAFDAPFFAIASEEASAMDPQQRGVLECTYRALENAGIPLSDAAGSQTGVYVGCFGADFAKGDIDSISKYTGSGSQSSMLSNRVSWFFDLRGPSMTIDTACSSSMVAAHQACMSLQLGETSMAIVAGSNLILEPDATLALDALGVLSPDGTSRSFDHKANGYARGEGFGAVVLKRISDAIQDGDTIRAVIRGSGSNQDGRSPGITHPLQSSQVELIRGVYSASGIDPSMTRFIEAHGTGTPVGDPIEAAAIAEVFMPYRSADDPLYVGAVKSNIGHLEGAAGIAGIIKAVFMLERGVIPANAWFEKRNPGIPDTWPLDFPTEAKFWPQQGLRRLSINSFGFGGANAHMVMDDAYHYLKEHQLSGQHQTLIRPGLIVRHTPTNDKREVNGFYTPPLSDDGQTIPHEEAVADHPQIFVLSSYDQGGTGRIRNVYADWLRLKSMERPGTELLKDISFTLASKRTHHAWREVFVADSHKSLQEGLNEAPHPVRVRFNPALAFVFTGQGAQWPAMGKELMVYSAFEKSLFDAGRYMDELGCPWSLINELTDKKASRIHEADYSQPICTALQVALVDLLSAWNMHPRAVVGHSSGEIAAAYAAGHISRESAWKIAYYRGKLCARLSRSEGHMRTGMAAVALDKDQTVCWIDRVNKIVPEGFMTIACVNSPQSHTVSGDMASIEALVILLQQQKILSRKLEVGIAYHSRYIEPISAEYADLIGEISPGARRTLSACSYFSSASDTPIEPSQLQQASYWVLNLISPVQFQQAVTRMLNSDLSEQSATSGSPTLITDVLEIGPHSTLRGPLRNISALCRGHDSIGYQSILTRGTPAISSTFKAAASLFCWGYPVDLSAVNKATGLHGKKPQMLSDLPGYPFDHTRSFTVESRRRRHPRPPDAGRHELLGAPTADWNQNNAVWRNRVRVSENPWIFDHQVSGELLYPAAGMLVMAIQASCQIAARDETLKAFRFQDVSFHTALRIPTDNQGIETQFCLRPHRLSSGPMTSSMQEFQLFSLDGDEWKEHCRGLVELEYETKPNPVNGTVADQMHTFGCAQRMDTGQRSAKRRRTTKEIYNNFLEAGLDFGPTFRPLKEAWLHPNMGLVAKGESTVHRIRRTMPHGYLQPHLIHPTTLDGFFQACIAPLTLDQERREQSIVPYHLKGLWVSATAFDTYTAFVQAKSTRCGAESSLAAVHSHNDQPLARVTNLTLKLLPHKASSNLRKVRTEEGLLAFRTQWNADPELVLPTQAVQAFGSRIAASPSSQRAHLQDCETLCLHYLRRLLDSNALRSAQLQNHSKSYLAWARRAVDRCPPELLERDISSLEADVSRAATPEGKLITAVARALPCILEGRINPLEILFSPDKLAENAYRSGYDAQRSYSHLCAYLDSLAHKNPTLRILEVGAGTGAATKSVMETLVQNSTPRFRHYDFTDISPSFFGQAKSMFKEVADFMSFRVLDVEQNVAAQGFDFEQYDVIIAANVLHATKSIDGTLRNVKSLLKPGGCLMLYEFTNPDLLSGPFCFGLLPGWWLSEDPDRAWSPILTVEGWNDHLEAAGFSTPRAVLKNYFQPGAKEPGSSVIVATPQMDGSHTKKSIRPVCIVVQQDSPAQQAVSSHLCCALTQYGPCRVIDIAALQVEDVIQSICIMLAELDHPILTNMLAEDFDSLKMVVKQCGKFYWVTRSGRGTAAMPDTELVTGLARVVRSERPGSTFVTISFEEEESTEAIVERTVQVLQKSSGLESSFRVVDGLIQIPRLVRAEYLDDHIKSQTATSGAAITTLAETTGCPLALGIGALALLDTLRFEDDALYGKPLAEHEIEFKAKACGINFKDLATMLGKVETPALGLEASGVVTRVGSATSFQIGDEVFGLGYSEGELGGALKTHVRSTEAFLARKPASLSWTEAASLPLVYTTAYGCLHEMGTLRKGNTILIHSAAGGLGQAAIQMAQHGGATVYATVGTVEKRDFLRATYDIPADHIFSSRDTSFKSQLQRMTASRGVDIVLNSLSGDALRATWDCVAPFGRFVELGLGDINANAHISMGNFGRHTRFESFDLSFLIRHDPVRAAAMFQAATRFVLHDLRFQKRETPTTVYPMSEVQQAFRFMQSGKHIGKLVLELHDEDVIPVLPRSKSTYDLRPNASYVISGGLGGLGKSIARWMVTRGARNLILLSRSGAVSDSSKDFVSELESMGASVATPACDIADGAALRQAIEACSAKMPPIRGCLQGSMVLKDNRFEHMTLDEWNTALRPKVQGSWNLHNVLDRDLDFFVLLASGTGIIGGREQANYAAGNTFQDALARYRVSQGLHGASLDLCAIKGAGFVAERPELMGMLRSAGVDFMTLEELHSVLDYYCSPDRRHLSVEQSQAILGLAMPHELVAAGISSPPCHRDPLFSHLPRFKAAPTETSVDGELARYDVLVSQAASRIEAQTIVLNALRLKLSRILSVDVLNLDPAQPMHAYGVDSLVAVELRTWASNEIGAELSILDVTSQPSVMHVATMATARSRFLPAALKG